MMNQEDSNLIKEVLERCDFLKKCHVWPNENKIRPRAWLNNFDEEDQVLAAKLLDRFVYYDESSTEKLLSSAYFSLLDGLPKGHVGATRDEMEGVIENAVFTSVTGESPNPTDSGNLFLRLIRQVLKIDEDRILTNSEALWRASKGQPIIFVDDFVGSGQQFLHTWHRKYDVNGCKLSYKDIYEGAPFHSCYVNLITLEYGRDRIYEVVPSVTISSAHTLGFESSIYGMCSRGEFDLSELDGFLYKYQSKLSFKEQYMEHELSQRKYGFSNRGMLLAFSHSVPDATLPIFWCNGPGWTPLIERS